MRAHTHTHTHIHTHTQHILTSRIKAISRNQVCTWFNNLQWEATKAQYNYIDLYGTAQFKLEARVWVTRMYFVAPLEYFSKSCVSVDIGTGVSRAIYARVTSPYMLADVRAFVHVTMHARSCKKYGSPRLTLFSV